MNIRICAALVGLVLALAAGGQHATAQALRPEDTAFLKPRLGASFYLGDNEQSPLNFNMDAFKIDGAFPYSLGLELGYQFSIPWSLSLAYQLADYPVITQFQNEEAGVIEDDPTTRHTLALVGRRTFADATSRFAPYLQGGLQASFGSTQTLARNAPNFRGGEESNTAFGPTLGLGLDIVVGSRVSFFVEATTNLSFPDDAVDGAEENFFGTDFGGFDLLNAYGVGLKINFKKPFAPVEVLSIDCPSELITGEAGTFIATTNAELATQPVSYRWAFGDGGSATTPSGTHTYSEAGSYTVEFTASNEGSTDTRRCTVEVIAPAEIVTLAADPTDPDTQTEVTFSANVRGTPPIDYQWDLGDGTTSTATSPSHTYGEAGTYTVELEVSNAGGADTRSLSLTVAVYEADYCSELTEMNSVYFERNSSVLTTQGREALQENVVIFEDCPNLNARLEGFAGPLERNPQQLSEDRARAVEQFYVDSGVAASRLTAVGRGRVEEAGAKKTGGEQYRRVDTIPLR